MILKFLQLESTNPIISQLQQSFVFFIAFSYLKFYIIKKKIRKAAIKCYIIVVVVVVFTVNKKEDSSKDASSILLEYSTYIKIFSTKRTKILALFNKHIYIINLESNVVLLYSFIYLLAKPELEVFREYFNNTIKKGQIQLSYSFANTLILFILKKSSQLKLYINYRALNCITQKNKALLLLVRKILN